MAERFAIRTLGRSAGVSGEPGSDPVDRLRASLGKRKLPEAVLGLVLISVGILGSLWLQNSSGSGVEIIVASNDLSRGHIISAGDLDLARVPEGVSKSFNLGANAKDLIGQPVVSDLPKGSPLPKRGSSTLGDIQLGEALTSVVVSAGSYAPQIVAGDRVLVVIVPDPSIMAGLEPYIYKTPATVWSVDSSTDELDSAVVTLKADSGLLLATAGAVEIRLALIPTVNG